MVVQHVLEILDHYRKILLKQYKKKIFMQYLFYLEIEILKDEYLPHIKANYLASPPLVVAYALAGHMEFDLIQRTIRKK